MDKSESRGPRPSTPGPPCGCGWRARLGVEWNSPRAGAASRKVELRPPLGLESRGSCGRCLILCRKALSPSFPGPGEAWSSAGTMRRASLLPGGPCLPVAASLQITWLTWSRSSTSEGRPEARLSTPCSQPPCPPGEVPTHPGSHGHSGSVCFCPASGLLFMGPRARLGVPGREPSAGPGSPLLSGRWAPGRAWPWSAWSPPQLAVMASQPPCSSFPADSTEAPKPKSSPEQPPGQGRPRAVTQVRVLGPEDDLASMLLQVWPPSSLVPPPTWNPWPGVPWARVFSPPPHSDRRCRAAVHGFHLHAYTPVCARVCTGPRALSWACCHGPRPSPWPPPHAPLESLLGTGHASANCRQPLWGRGVGSGEGPTCQPRGPDGCLSPDLPAEPQPAVAELQCAPCSPGAAAGPGPGAGASPPGEPRGARRRGAPPAGPRHPAELPARRRPGHGHAPEPLPRLPSDAPALPVPGRPRHSPAPHSPSPRARALPRVAKAPVPPPRLGAPVARPPRAPALAPK